MERTYLEPGAIIAPKINPEELFKVLKVYEHCGVMWVDVVKARYCLPMPLDEVQNRFEVVYTAAEMEDR